MIPTIIFNLRTIGLVLYRYDLNNDTIGHIRSKNMLLRNIQE
jgi:hypothetical protein